MRQISLKKLLPILPFVILLFLSSCAENQRTTCGQNAVLVPGLGSYSRDIRTDSEHAQKFFDQGLRLTMGYYFPEAISSHFEALCYDDDNPMIYWGLALAIAPNPNSRNWGLPDDPKGEGAKAINKALELLEQANEVEKGLIQALAIRYDKGTIPIRRERDEAYITACEKLNQKFPDDLEVTFLLVDAVMTSKPWAYWDKQGNPSEGIQEIINALDQSMNIDNLHPGNNHLYLHLFEASQYPEKSLPQAKRLEGLMPKAGHMVHMPSHIYLRLGLYDSTISVNQRSLKADKYFLEKWGDKPFSKVGTYGLSAQVHPAHALDFIRFAATARGKYEQAIKASRTAAATIPKSSYHTGKAQHFLTVPYFILKNFGRWDEILANPRPNPEYPYLEGIWHYTRASAFLAKANIDSAKAELQKIKQLESPPVIKGSNGKVLLELAKRGLEGEILYAEGDFESAIEIFKRAVQQQDQLGYSEPPSWSQSMRLYLGDALFQAGEYANAELVFKEDLDEFKENGWALFGLWKSLELQNKTDEAEDIKLRFENVWSESDIELQRARF